MHSVWHNVHKSRSKSSKTCMKKDATFKTNKKWLKSSKKSLPKSRPTFPSSRKFSSLPQLPSTFTLTTLHGCLNRVYYHSKNTMSKESRLSSPSEAKRVVSTLLKTNCPKRTSNNFYPMMKLFSWPTILSTVMNWIKKWSRILLCTWEITLGKNFPKASSTWGLLTSDSTWDCCCKSTGRRFWGWEKKPVRVDHQKKGKMRRFWSKRLKRR